jgi:nicotinamidase-related amidase
MSTQAPRRALIVIDVQNEYVDGNFRIEYPPVESSLFNIGKAIDAANAHGVPVVLVQHVLPADAPIFAEGSVGVQLHPSVKNRKHDFVVTKILPSSSPAQDLMNGSRRMTSIP